MSDRRNDIQVGLFSIIAVLLLAMMILIFGGFKNVLVDTYRVTAHFDNAAGTTEGTPVRLLGIEVGNVRSVTLDPETGGVVMVLTINKGVSIREDAPLAIRQEGFIANIYLDFGMGTSEKILPKDGTARVEGKIETFAAYVEGATTVVADMGGSMKEKFNEISDHLLDLLDNVNDLAGDEKFRGDLKQLASNTTEVTSTLKDKLPGLLDEMQTVAARAKKSLDEASGLMDTYRQLGEKLTETTEAGREEIERQGDNLDRLTKALTESAVDVSALAKGLTEITTAIRSGEGTLGKLLSDPELYRALVGAIDELENAAGEIKELAETIKKHPDWLLKGPPPSRQ